MANNKPSSTSVLWVTYLLALFYIYAGFRTLEPEAWKDNFSRWGYPDSWRTVMGGLEIVCGGLLFIPRLTWFAAMILAALMVALAATYLIHDGPVSAAIPALLFLSLISLTYYRYPWQTPPPPA